MLLMETFPQLGDRYELLGSLATHVTVEFGPDKPKEVVPPSGNESQVVVIVNHIFAL